MVMAMGGHSSLFNTNDGENLSRNYSMGDGWVVIVLCMYVWCPPTLKSETKVESGYALPMVLS